MTLFMTMAPSATTTSLSPAVTVILSVVASVGFGTLASAMITRRSERDKQFREALLSAVETFADRAVQAIDDLKEIRPPRPPSKLRNEPMISDLAVRKARLEQCHNSLVEARAATGRITILCGPKSAEATAGQSFYYHANEAYKTAARFYEDLPTDAQLDTLPSVDTDFKKGRDKAFAALDTLGEAVVKRIG